jgi:transcriptional regulator with XRE-family HTH domain
MHKDLFRKNLKSIMGKLGMSQQELADKMGIKQQQISYWLTGKNSPTYKSLTKLSDALGKPINFFLENYGANNSVVGADNVRIVTAEKAGGHLQGNENLTKDVEVLKKDIEILKLQIELLKKDLLIEQNKK